MVARRGGLGSARWQKSYVGVEVVEGGRDDRAAAVASWGCLLSRVGCALGRRWWPGVRRRWLRCCMLTDVVDGDDGKVVRMLEMGRSIAHGRWGGEDAHAVEARVVAADEDVGGRALATVGRGGRVGDKEMARR